MRFFGNNDMSGEEASAQIKSFQKGAVARAKAKDFKVWANMYATPFARDLLFKDHLQVARNERRAAELMQKPDAGVKAVAEVAKVSDKLMETKQKQAEIQQEITKKVAAGDTSTATQLMQADQMLQQKAQRIEGQLAERVSEGTALAQAKGVAEKSRTEVIQKRQAQAQAAPHLADVWSKHDALYERDRAGVLRKHDQAEMEATEIKALLAQMPRGVEKDAKMERLRKEEANRRVTQELELAKLDQSEAGRLDGRAKVAGMKQIS